jgi:hypothetical protein
MKSKSLHTFVNLENLTFASRSRDSPFLYQERNAMLFKEREHRVSHFSHFKKMHPSVAPGKIRGIFIDRERRHREGEECARGIACVVIQDRRLLSVYLPNR